MKKFTFILIIGLLTACGTYRGLDLNRLTTGMSKSDVERVAGLPDRILAVNETSDGYQEVLEYRTSRGEIYALEFWNDYLTGYEYLYDDVQYVAYPHPPAIFPPYGRPLYVYPGGVYRPDYRPNNRPGYQIRPPANRPNTNVNTTTRPPERTPSRDQQSSTPSGNSQNNTNTERPGRGTR